MDCEMPDKALVSPYSPECVDGELSEVYARLR
jgi:hypothetical protein